uniref:probable serine/threonine-protein kinase ifkA n=1 Tax=Styela clava TaxID=7725 RepID=UPI00193ABE43|nr:probable serine/threonine-protein kinase ifkA [Styela clava]
MEKSIPNTLAIFRCDAAPVTEFDNSDLLEHNSETVSGSSLSSSSSKVKSQYVPIIRQSLLISSLLEQLCSLYETDKVKSQKLYFILCDQLANLGIISPVAYLEEFTSVHTQYKKTLYNIIQSSIMKLDSKPAFPANCDITKLLDSGGLMDCKPIIPDQTKVFDFDTSRYGQEFDELGKLGSGGYGSVYRARSKIDGQEYAIKKIVLRDSLVGESDKILLREVRILAGLRHKNIVRYHGAWIEHIDVGEEVRVRGRRDLLEDVNNLQCSNNGSSHDDSYSFGDNDSKPFQSFSKNGLKKNKKNRSKIQLSKFWGGSSASETSASVQNKKIHFSISPPQSDEDLVFQDSKPRHIDTSYNDRSSAANPESPPKETILTHGVRRDMNMHRVKSFIITKDLPPAANRGDFTKPVRTQSLSTFQDRLSTNSLDLDCVAIGKKSKSFVHSNLRKGKLVLNIQMELCQTSLKRWLSLRNKNIFHRNESFHEGTSLHCMRQIVSALNFIHSKDLIHRDVKPHNIFLNLTGYGKPHLLLGDFGLAKNNFASPVDSTVSNHSSQNTFYMGLRRTDSHTSGVGTTSYAAPEQLFADVYDAKVDMYSFAIVAYELWTPFETAMERASHLKQLRNQIVPSEFILEYPQLGKLLTSLLNHDPKMRPSSQEIFEGDFFEKSKDKIIDQQAERIHILETEIRDLKVMNKKLQRQLNNRRSPP